MKRVTWALVFLASTLPVFAQGDKAVVVGTVTDSTGAFLVGAQVELKRVSTNDVFKTQSSDTGDYAFRGLTPDTYELRVTAQGFKTEVQSGLKFELGGITGSMFRWPSVRLAMWWKSMPPRPS